MKEVLYKQRDLTYYFFYFLWKKSQTSLKQKTKGKDLHIHHEFQRSESELANLEEIVAWLVGKHLDHEDLVFVVSLIKHLVEVELHVQPW